jgi:polyferredoxin
MKLSPDIIALIILMALGIIGYLLKKRILRYLTLLVSVGFIGFYYGNCLAGPGQVQNLTFNISKFSATLPYYFKIAIIIIPGILLGAVFCGWVCPMGAFQEIFNFSQTKRTKNKTLLKIDGYLRYIRFGAMIILLIYPFIGKDLLHNLNPFRVIFGFAYIPDYPMMLMIFGGIIVISSVFIHRPWCRYLCPFGAIMSLTSKFSLFKITLKDETACVSCGICERTCKIGAIVMEDKTPKILHWRCIRCGECIMPCPKDGLDISRK